jgi:hypothetical protein
MTAFVKYLALATVLFAIVSLPVAGAEPKLPIVRQYAPGVTEIIS